MGQRTVSDVLFHLVKFLSCCQLTCHHSKRVKLSRLHGKASVQNVIVVVLIGDWNEKVLTRPLISRCLKGIQDYVEAIGGAKSSRIFELCDVLLCQIEHFVPILDQWWRLENVTWLKGIVRITETKGGRDRLEPGTTQLSALAARWKL